MIRDLFINSTILISFTFIWGQAVRTSKASQLSPLTKKLALGAACGVLGTALIFFTIQTAPGVFVDLRTIAVMIAVAYGGRLSASISALMIISVRMLFFGVSKASLAAASNLVLIIVFCHLIKQLKAGSLKKWLYMLAANTAVVAVTIFTLLNNTSPLSYTAATVLQLSIALFTAGTIAYYSIEYVLKSNISFQQLKVQSTTDFLTGLNNIRQFDSYMNEFSRRVINNNEKLSLLLIDIDHFKSVNDTYGHAAGDSVLKQLGKVLVSACRSIDIVSRNGGEEFSVLLPACPYDQALEVAERVRKAVKEYRFVLPDEKAIGISVSIGAATYPDTVNCLNKIFIQADDALYKAKRSGRDKVFFIDNCIV